MKQQTFSVALDALKEGKTVAREDWNGEGVYLFLVKDRNIIEVVNDKYGNPERKAMLLLNVIYMNTANDTLVPWLANQIDLLSEDWIIDPYKK